MFLNDNEEKIIGSLMKNADDLEGKVLLLKWNDESLIKGIFDSYIEDESDLDINDADYEEFWSFVFKAIDLKGTPPVFITEDEFFCINYHNFPDEIFIGNQKIN